MHQHFGLDDKHWNTLQEQGITAKDLWRSLEFFDPYKSGAEISPVSLFYYIDKKGDFQEKKDKFDLIACEVFDTLGIKDKIAVAEYVEWEDEEDVN